MAPTTPPKAMWSGVLELNTAFKLHVSICKANESYRGRDPISDLCACHHKPFKRSTVCEGGRIRLTDELEKSGETENTVEVIKGVPGDGEEYVELSDAWVEAIKAAGTSDGMAVAAVVDLASVPTERYQGLYYVRPDSKVKRSKGPVEVVLGALERVNKAIITKWAPRGRELLVAIYAKDEALMLNVLMYESEVKAPDAKCLIGSDEVSEAEIDVAVQVLATLPGEFEFSAAQDDAVIVRQEAIEAARNGEEAPTREPVAAEEGTSDLMAVLLAATTAAPVVKDIRSSQQSNGAVPVGASQ
ncbi:MAG: Ku protein [Solirubrobacteraceae bacterium]